MGINLERDTGLNYRCEPMLTRKPAGRVTAAGERFQAEWASALEAA